MSDNIMYICMGFLGIALVAVIAMLFKLLERIAG